MATAKTSPLPPLQVFQDQTAPLDQRIKAARDLGKEFRKKLAAPPTLSAFLTALADPKEPIELKDELIWPLCYFEQGVLAVLAYFLQLIGDPTESLDNRQNNADDLDSLFKPLQKQVNPHEHSKVVHQILTTLFAV